MYCQGDKLDMRRAKGKWPRSCSAATFDKNFKPIDTWECLFPNPRTVKSHSTSEVEYGLNLGFDFPRIYASKFIRDNKCGRATLIFLIFISQSYSLRPIPFQFCLPAVSIARIVHHAQMFDKEDARVCPMLFASKVRVSQASVPAWKRLLVLIPEIHCV